MNHVNLRSFLRDSVIITTVLGVISGVLATAISNSLFSRKPNWQYALTIVLFIAVCILVRFVITLYASIRALATSLPSAEVAITKTAPPLRVSVGEALMKASTELVFFGISAKRSVTDDIFKSALAAIADPQLRIRFLLLDPTCEAFEQRARDEGEPSETWRQDQQTTITRLSAYKRARGLNIELRLFSFYPVWRAIIVDRQEVFVSVFMPGRRGTEASQYQISRINEELAYGIISSYHTAWHAARSIEL
jgi:hypothetical protein